MTSRRSLDIFYQDEFGMTRRSVVCLIAIVARWIAEEKPVSHTDLTDFVSEVEGMTTAGECLAPLRDGGYIEPFGKDGARVLYRPTTRGARAVRTWCGERERAA